MKNKPYLFYPLNNPNEIAKTNNSRFHLRRCNNPWHGTAVASRESSFYSAVKMNGNLLKSMYAGDFSRIVLNFKYNTTAKKFELSPLAFSPSGAALEVNQRLITILTTGKSISSDRTLIPFTMEHNRISGLLQLQTLISIVNAYPSCYFNFNPEDYATVEPTDHTHICYKIVAFTGAGREIDVSGYDKRAFQLNPNPPGHPY